MEWKVPLFDPDLGVEEAAALAAVIESKWLTMGDRTRDFETAFTALTGASHAIAVSNGTTALHLALLAVGVQPGDEVVCPALTFVATANAVRYCGAVPVFADVTSLEDWNVCRTTIEPLLSSRTRAILVVHYAGYVCDMAPILALARARGLAVVEDVAHAPGASREGRAAGTWGDAGCFSFFSNKNLTTGEGGMVTTSRDDVAAKVRTLRSHGMTTLTLDRYKGHAFSYDVVALGYNYRMGELNAALGLAQVRHLAARNARRREHVEYYRERLEGLPELGIPFPCHPGVPAYHIMPVLLPPAADRNTVMTGLASRGVQCSIHYRPVDTFTAYQEAGLGPCSHLVQTHEIGRRELTLPLYPSMDGSHIDIVVDALESVMTADARVSQ